MEELKIRMQGMEMAVSGGQLTLKEAAQGFYRFLADREQRELAEKAAFTEHLKEVLARSAASTDEKEREKQTIVGTGSATLRAIRTSATSWTELAREIKSGKGLNVGDKIDFKMKNGEDITVVVVQDTDEYVRFESVDCVGGNPVQWNRKDKTDGGIKESHVQEYLMTEIFDQLPDDLQAAINKTKRKYLDNEGNVKEYETRLFLPAASEVFDEDECYGDEGLYEQLEYYKDRRHRMKGTIKGEDMCGWWLASVGSGYSTYACLVGSGGSANIWNASNATRVPLCFLIKKS